MKIFQILICDNSNNALKCNSNNLTVLFNLDLCITDQIAVIFRAIDLCITNQIAVIFRAIADSDQP